MAKKELTSAQKAAQIIKKESDPKLQNELLKQLMIETEAKAKELGLREDQSQQGQQFNPQQMGMPQHGFGGLMGMGGLKNLLPLGLGNIPGIGMAGAALGADKLGLTDKLGEVMPKFAFGGFGLGDAGGSFANTLFSGMDNSASGIGTMMPNGMPIGAQPQSMIGAASNNPMGGVGAMMPNATSAASNIQSKAATNAQDLSYLGANPMSKGNPGKYAPGKQPFLSDKQKAFGMQMIPSAISGATNLISNGIMAKNARDLANTAKGSASITKHRPISSKKVDLSRERAASKKHASDSRAIAKGNLSRTARSRGEYIAGDTASNVARQRTLDDTVSKSLQAELLAQQAQDMGVQKYNSQARMSNDARNAQAIQQAQALENQWLAQEMAARQAQYGAIPGMMGDAMKIGAQNQMYNSLGNRYGYEQQDWRTPNQWQSTYQG